MCGVCVYILSGVSIYSHGDPGQNGQSPNIATDCQMVSSVSYESATEILVLFTKSITEVLDLNVQE